MKKIFAFGLLCILSLNGFTQNLDKIYFEVDFNTKISIGEPTRRTINYASGVTANVPKKSTFDSPVYGINLSVNYKINNNISLGFGSGLNFVKNETHPVITNEYLDKTFIPLYAKFTYQFDLDNNWDLSPTLNLGYQHYDFNYGNTKDGFTFREKGGLLTNLDIGIGKKIGKYKPIFKVGYELNSFHHKNRLKLTYDKLNYNEKVNFTTYYHLIKLSLSIRM